MADEITGIYDKVFKRILTLSNVAVINFINGIFDRGFPTDSKITYNWTENVKDGLERTIADTIVTINQTEKFHLEVQIDNGETMVLRVFDYGYQDALKYKKVNADRIKLRFPESKIIYLEHDSNTPDEVVLEMDFPNQGKFEYKIPTMKFLDYSIEELEQRHMVILLPLYLLKLRKEIRKRKTTENAKALKSLIEDGIIKTIEQNVKQGNLFYEDADVLINLLKLLYENLYGRIEEFEKEGVDSMIAERITTYSEEARKESKLEIAKNLLEMGMEVETVARATGLTEEDIVKLMDA